MLSVIEIILAFVGGFCLGGILGNKLGYKQGYKEGEVPVVMGRNFTVDNKDDKSVS